MPALDNSEISLQCWKMYGGNKRAHYPVTLPGLKGVLYAEPCEAQNGGDLYYLSACGSGVTARVCLADAAGHGEHSAEVGAWFEEIFGRHIHRMSTSIVLRDVNARAAAVANFQAVATALCVSYNALNGQLRFSNAGHPHGLVFQRESWTIGTLSSPSSGGKEPSNLPLGVMASTRYDVASQRLAPGDRLLLFTDGVFDAPDDSGEMLGLERLRSAFLDSAHLMVEEQGAQLIAVLTSFMDSTAHGHDDMTFLLLEALPYMNGNRFYHLIRNNMFKKSE